MIIIFVVHSLKCILYSRCLIFQITPCLLYGMRLVRTYNGKIYVCKVSDSFKKTYESVSVKQLGDNCIQIFHLGRYIVGYTVGNFVLRRRVRVSESIPQNILSQISDVVQSDIALYSQVH